MVKKSMKGKRTAGRVRKQRRSNGRMWHFRLNEAALAGTLAHGLVGLDNLFNFDFSAMGRQFVNSIRAPMAPGGLVDDCIDAASAYGAISLVGYGAQLANGGKNPGMTVGKSFRISIK